MFPGISATKYCKPDLTMFCASDVRENERELVWTSTNGWVGIMRMVCPAFALFFVFFFTVCYNSNQFYCKQCAVMSVWKKSIEMMVFMAFCSWNVRALVLCCSFMNYFSEPLLWMNEWMNEWINEWMNEWMNEWINEWMNEWMNEVLHSLKMKYFIHWTMN